MFDAGERDKQFIANILNIKTEEIDLSDDDEIFNFIPEKYLNGETIEEIDLEEH